MNVMSHKLFLLKLNKILTRFEKPTEHFLYMGVCDAFSLQGM